MRLNPKLVELRETLGISMDGAVDLLPRAKIKDANGRVVKYGAIDRVAMDAQPVTVTTPSAGIPFWMTQFVDPQLIRIFTQPNKAMEVMGGEVRKGQWSDDTAQFGIIEALGFVSSYGDYNMNGRMGSNINWEFRQNYRYQGFIEWGDLEAERMGRANVEWAQEQRTSRAIIFDKFANNVAFFGIAGIANYGLLNDPSLSAAITPTTKVATGTSWQNALPTEILADIQKMYATLTAQTGYNIDLDTPMTLVVSPISMTYLANTNSFGLTAEEMIKKVFPNLKIVSAPQYINASTGTNVYSGQLIVDNINGRKTAQPAFSEKMRLFPMITEPSAWTQKAGAGTWGTIIFNPTGIVSIVGI